MGIFGGKSGDVLDFTMLQKRGILKKKEPEKDIVDLTGPQPSTITAVPSPSPLSFFDTIAPSSPSVFNTPSPNPQEHGGDIQTLRVKIDDLEYKLDRFLERLDMIESRLGDVTPNIR
ncbi:hypothetical protein KW805_00385 [Candidatus Pacearchaeota archaeon]|nr:hypothetical protein [Candidatus Pacearchaeota archaeon]